jgi:hypothetical protein
VAIQRSAGGTEPVSPSPPKRSGGERPERRLLGVDLDGAAAVPDDPDMAAIFDVVDDAAIAGREAGRVGHELDASPDGDARLDAGSQETSAKRIHGRVIGSEDGLLKPLSGRIGRHFV